MKSLLPFLAAAGLLAGTASTVQSAANPQAAPAAAPSASADSIVAKGKGVEIKRSQVDEEVNRIKASYTARGQTLPPEHMAMVAPSALERLIQLQLLLSRATAADKAKAKEESATQFQTAKTNAPSEEEFDKQLKQMGMTQEVLHTKMTEAATAQAVLERELSINTTDAEVKKFYDENPAKFEQPEMVRASHILLTTSDPTTKTDLPAEQKAAKRKQIDALLKRARAGEDFAKLAKEFSEDPGSKANGGEYTFAKGRMSPEFETAAFSLKTNEVSDVITTQYGYHIIKLSEKMPPQKIELAKIAPQIKKYLTGQAMSKQTADYFAKAKKEAGVEILDEKLKPQEMPSGASGLPAGHPPVGAGKKDSAK